MKKTTRSISLAVSLLPIALCSAISCASSYKTTALSAAVAADVVVDDLSEQYSVAQLARLEYCVGSESASGSEWTRFQKSTCMGKYSNSDDIQAAIRTVIVAQRAISLLAFEDKAVSVSEWARMLDDLQAAIAALKALGASGSE